MQVGDEVLGAGVTGAAAEYAVLDHWTAKPETISWAEAGGLVLAVETAARGLDLLGVATGATVLVSGAAGGVGVAAVQLARARGAAGVGTASPGNLEFLRSLGAVAVPYGPGLVQRVREAMPEGVALALDVAGHGALADLIGIVGGADRVVSVGDPDAASLGVRFTTGAEGRAFHALPVAADLSRRGELSMPVAATFALTDLPAAHAASETGHVRGKLIVVLD